MREVIIMRGPAGSGKSTWARKNHPDAVVVSADHFWLVEMADGRQEYIFNIAQLPEAHQVCLCRFIDVVVAGHKKIVVDNTNIRKWQYRAYAKIARAYGYAVHIVEFRPVSISDIRKCVDRNIHGVPEETVIRMCMEFEEDPDAEEIIRISSG